MAAGGEVGGGGEVGAVAPASAALRARPMARWVLPRPGGPMSRTLVAFSR